MTTAAVTRPRVRAKEFHFPVEVEWIGGRRVSTRVAGKHAVEVAPPPVFSGTDPEAWSPEDFFVGAAASCLAVTFTGLAERDGVRYESLRVTGDGVAGMRADGRFGFTRLRLALEVAAADEVAELVRRLAEKAEERCLVAASVDVPVETDIVVSSS